MTAITPSKPYKSHLLRPGNTNCAGCGMSIGLQWLDEALGDEQPVLVIPSCCGIVTAGAFPTSGYGVPPQRLRLPVPRQLLPVFQLLPI